MLSPPDINKVPPYQTNLSNAIDRPSARALRSATPSHMDVRHGLAPQRVGSRI